MPRREITKRKLISILNLEGTSTTAGTESALSDHYPIWANFKVNSDTN